MPLCFGQFPAHSGTVLAVVALAASVSSAQDIEPRAYANTPVGLNFLITGYDYLKGGVAIDPLLPLKDTNVHVHATLLAYACTASSMAAPEDRRSC